MLISRKSNKVVIVMCAFITLCTTIIYSDTVEVTVVGKNNTIKPFVAINVIGTDIQTYTDKEGKFTLDLEPNKYVIKVFDKNRVMQFKISVPKNKNLTKTFKLKWF